MRFTIVGVGQTFNLETREMEDTLQVQTPAGVISVPTTNEAAQQLISLAMNGHGGQRREELRGARELVRKVEEHFEGGTEVMADSPYPIQSTGDLPGGDFPEGASVFGGQLAAAPPQSTEGHMDQEPEGLADARPRMFAKTQQTYKAPAVDLGKRRNPADRSGVPSYGISRVDEKGNPVLPAPPDIMMDEEEDPGEQV
jgi:hypothetical protein